MMKASPLRAHIAILLLISALPVLAWAHGGRVDSRGCHNDRKRGEYHCHKGELAEQSFPSTGKPEIKNPAPLGMSLMVG